MSIYVSKQWKEASLAATVSLARQSIGLAKRYVADSEMLAFIHRDEIHVALVYAGIATPVAFEVAYRTLAKLEQPGCLAHRAYKEMYADGFREDEEDDEN